MIKINGWLRQNWGKVSLGLLIAFLLAFLTLPTYSLAQSEGESYYYFTSNNFWIWPIVEVKRDEVGKIVWSIDYNWKVQSPLILTWLQAGPAARLAYRGEMQDRPDGTVVNYLVTEQKVRFEISGGYLYGYLVYFAYAGSFDAFGRKGHPLKVSSSDFNFYTNIGFVTEDVVGRLVVKPTPTPRPPAQGQAPLPNQRELPQGFSWVAADVLDMFPPKKTWVWIAEVARKIAQQTNRPYEDVLSEIQLINGNGYIPGSFGGYVVGKMTKIAVKSQDAPWPQAPQPRPYTEGDIYDVYAPIEILDEAPRYYFICQDGCEKGKVWDGYRYPWMNNPIKIRPLTETEKAFVQYVRNNLTFRYWDGSIGRIPLTEELFHSGLNMQETSGYPWQFWVGILWTETPRLEWSEDSDAGAMGRNQMLQSTFDMFKHSPEAYVKNGLDNDKAAVNDQIDLGLGPISRALWVCRFATINCGIRVWNYHETQAGNAWDFAMFIDGEWQKFQNDWYAGRRG